MRFFFINLFVLNFSVTVTRAPCEGQALTTRLLRWKILSSPRVELFCSAEAMHKRRRSIYSKEPNSSLKKTKRVPKESPETSCSSKPLTSKPFLFIWNLPSKCCPVELSNYLGSVCSPSHVKIIRDKVKKFPRYAFAFFNQGDEISSVIAKLHGRPFKQMPLCMEEGIPESKDSLMILSRKRREKTGLIASSAYHLNATKAVQVEFMPPIILSPTRAVDFFSCLLPSYISISKVYVCEKTQGVYVFELPSPLYAASLTREWNSSKLPSKYLKKYLTSLEFPSSHDSESPYVVLKLSCFSPHMNKIVKAMTSNDVLKNPAPLKIENLSTLLSEHQLFHILKGYGLIRKLRLENATSSSDTAGSSSSNTATVYYKTTQAATEAQNALNGKIVCGRPLKVFWAVGKKTADHFNHGLLTIPFPDVKRMDVFSSLNIN